MKAAIGSRNRIPFYCNKTQNEYRNDIYERYDPMVIRQSMIHLSDSLWDGYPMQSILDYIYKNAPEKSLNNILEIGCGVGRMIAELAKYHPQSDCWGVDFSYQMLKRANEFWIENQEQKLDYSKFGFSNKIYVGGSSIGNLKFGLAKFEKLPFDRCSQDLIISSFVFDRLKDPVLGLEEMKRVLDVEGKIILVTPLNFKHIDNWNKFLPLEKFKNILLEMNLKIIDWDESLRIEEPLDNRDNKIIWNCVAMVLGKR